MCIISHHFLRFLWFILFKNAEICFVPWLRPLEWAQAPRSLIWRPLGSACIFAFVRLGISTLLSQALLQLILLLLYLAGCVDGWRFILLNLDLLLRAAERFEYLLLDVHLLILQLGLILEPVDDACCNRPFAQFTLVRGHWRWEGIGPADLVERIDVEFRVCLDVQVVDSE